MNKPITIVKYDSKTKNVLCECGGDCMVDGEGHYELPIGIGFHEDGKFYVDKVRFTGYFGECMDCRKRVLAYKSKKMVSKRVKLGKEAA
jgi:hypothetical protein